jgi:hypothetical protein
MNSDLGQATIPSTAVILSKGDHARLQAATIRLRGAERENNIMRAALRDCWYMARRYVDGANNYATAVYNDHTRVLLSLDVDLNIGVDGTPWARDAMGRGCDGLTEAEAMQGQPPQQKIRLEDQSLERLALLERVVRAADRFVHPGAGVKDFDALMQALDECGVRR